MTVEQRFEQTDFSPLSRVKDSLLWRLKLRRKAINEEMSLDELENVAAAAGRSERYFIPKMFDTEKNRQH